MKYLACVLCLAAVAFGSPDVFARVRDGETKLPLVGASVMSEGSDIMAVTDSSGRCLVVVAPRRGGALVASRQGYLGQTLTGAWPAKSVRDAVVIDFLLYPNRPESAGDGAAGADTKVAIPGAVVPVGGSAPAEPARAGGGAAISDSAAGPRKVGEPHAAVQPGVALVEAERTEAAEASRSPAEAANVGSVEGVVSDARTGLPLPGASVAVGETEFAASTDSAGRYVIASVPVGMHKLLVTRAGYVNAYTVVRLVTDWAVTVNLYLRESASPSPFQ